jgi:colicin import membrane protein
VSDHTAPLVEVSDLSLAVDYLMETAGGNREQALEVLAADPGFTQRLAPAIEQRRAQLQANADAAVRAEYERSPEGRREAMQAAAERNEQRQRDARNARLLATDEHPEEAEIFERMSDTEILRFIGAEADPAVEAERQREAQANDPKQRQIAAERELAQRWFQMSPGDRPAAAQAIGVDPRAAEDAAWKLARSRGLGGPPTTN